jgi:hypothetical protein
MVRRPTRLLVLIAIVAGGWSASAAAVSVEGLYSASIEVADKSDDARGKAFRRALERVVVRAAGRDEVVAEEAVRTLLANAEGYVQQYQYEAIEREPDSAAGGGGSDGAGDDAGAAESSVDEPLYRLKVKFIGSRIEQALADRGVTVWGRQRPEVLVWLAVDDGERRYIVGAEGDTPVHADLTAAAKQRGLPLLLPLLDTADRNRVDFRDIKGGFLDAIRTASERYRAQTFLVGYIERRGRRWLGDWQLLGLGGERRSWRGRADGLPDAVSAGVGGATERIAATFAGRAGQIERVRLRVRGVGAVDAYARVSTYLEQLARVRTASVAAIRAGEAVFRIQIHGTVAQLQRSIALADTLVPAQRARPSGTAGADAPGQAGDGTPGSAKESVRMPARQRAPVPELMYRLAS